MDAQTGQRTNGLGIRRGGEHVMATLHEGFGHPCPHASRAQDQHLLFWIFHRRHILRMHWHKDCFPLCASHYI